MASWHITEDKIDGCEAVGQWNSRTLDTLEEVEAKCKWKFRLLDDDGEVYYVGYSGNSSSFSPLDDFGMPNAGCTDIQYFENGRWESL